MEHRALVIAVAEANNKLRLIGCARREREHALNVVTRATLATEFDEQLNAATIAVRDAKKALEDAKVAAAPSHAKYPIGTVLLEWARHTERFSSKQFPLQLTGVRGVLEVFTAESAWPENQRWSRPGIGDVVVRPLKKDGKPAAKCLVLGEWRTGVWLPEGEQPQRGAEE